MDDHSGFNNTASEILQVEAELLKNADLVITTSAALSDKVEETRKNTLIRNAADSNWFSQPPENVAYQSDKPVIGYFGAISEWFDIELVIKAAQAYPEYDFVLIGSTYLCDTAKAKTVPNIHFIGEVPYADLKGYLYAFDVCLIPFKLTDLIYYTNPVKLYEYLAAGKPVVATAMPELLLVKEHVFVAQDTASFISKIQQALESKDDVSGIKSRQEFALKNQWSNRVEKLEKTIESIYPSVSIIVLTYNNLEFTRKCLKSLMEFTNYPNWELVIVDNASSDDSPEFLQTFAKQYDNVKVILNKENVGFSAGNNIGIENSTGEFLVLLNNDTVVTRGWLWDLIRYFLKEKSLGLLGPVTNNIGNEAKISIEYANMEEMARESRKYTSEHSRELFYVNTVAFFCAVIRRQVIEEIGLLDEVFGCGFFEDDDYCIRARNAGFKVAIADDVYIHHHLSASFSQLKEETKKQLFDKNKAIYEEKWGPWVPHTYRS
ncbi:MAG: glycosyltransferase [Planctomycetes bacterium]|nr:glycosyltransferase [Planctomycetota bacterium]MCH9776698.1 glycosyltransferase [Planctomycetota bacterium]